MRVYHLNHEDITDLTLHKAATLSQFYHTVRPRCFKDDSTSQCNSMKRVKFDLHCPQNPKPLVTKFGMGDEVGETYPCAKFCYDPIRGFRSPPPLLSHTGRCKQSDSASSVFLRGGFFLFSTAKHPFQIFTIETSNDVVSCKDVPFGGPPKNANFWAIFGTEKIFRQKSLNNGDAHL